MPSTGTYPCPFPSNRLMDDTSPSLSPKTLDLRFLLFVGTINPDKFRHALRGLVFTNLTVDLLFMRPHIRPGIG